MSNSLTARLCFDPSLPLKSTLVSACFFFLCYVCFPVFCGIFIASLSQTSSHQTSNWLQKGGDFCHSSEPGGVLFGFPEWSSKCFAVTRRQLLSDVCFFSMVYWEPQCCFSLSPQEAEWHCDEFTKGACFSRGKSEVSLSDVWVFEMSGCYIALSNSCHRVVKTSCVGYIKVFLFSVKRCTT